jgi:Arc/MetJ-type ribon-helix-helix transcriptional regulator
MLFGWRTDADRTPNGIEMANLKLIDTSRPKGGETEKITINLGPVDLGQIDLLVEEGFYSNRTDLIRTAIRNQLAVHAQVVTETVTRRALVLGLQHFSKDWTFMCSALPASQPMCRQNSRQPRSHRWRCLAHFTRRPRSRPRSPAASDSPARRD